MSQTTEISDLVAHNGQIRRLSDLAEHMEYDHREEIHFGNATDETPQSFWARFAEKFPEEADYLLEITPDASPDEL